jgi:NADH dehydrogenase
MLNKFVSSVAADSISLNDGSAIGTRTVVWTTGVRAEPIAESSRMTVARDGRIEVESTMQVAGHPEVYAVGDLARIRERESVLPMVAQVAIQSGEIAAKNIIRQMNGREPESFAYKDLGSMVVIGRNAAGAEIGGRTYKGFFAWLLWLGVHLARLIGYRNRLVVLINWAWDYIFYERALRFIFPSAAATGKKVGEGTEKDKTRC